MIKLGFLISDKKMIIRTFVEIKHPLLSGWCVRNKCTTLYTTNAIIFLE